MPFINETIDILDIKISTAKYTCIASLRYLYRRRGGGRYDCSRIMFEKRIREVPAVFSLYARSLREILVP